MVILFKGLRWKQYNMSPFPSGWGDIRNYHKIVTYSSTQVTITPVTVYILNTWTDRPELTVDSDSATDHNLIQLYIV